MQSLPSQSPSSSGKYATEAVRSSSAESKTEEESQSPRADGELHIPNVEEESKSPSSDGELHIPNLGEGPKSPGPNGELHIPIPGRRGSQDSDTMVKLGTTRHATVSITPPYYPLAIFVFVLGVLVLASGAIMTGLGWGKDDFSVARIFQIVGPLLMVVGVVTQVLGIFYFAVIGHRHKTLKKTMKGFSTVAKYNSSTSPTVENPEEYVLVKSTKNPLHLEQQCNIFLTESEKSKIVNIGPRKDIPAAKDPTGRYGQYGSGKQNGDCKDQEADQRSQKKKHKRKKRRRKRGDSVDPQYTTQVQKLGRIENGVIAGSSTIGGNNLMQQAMRTVDLSQYMED